VLNNNISPDVSQPQVLYKKYIKNIRVENVDSMFQKNMENVSLSVKEEIVDETKNGSSILHHDIGVLEEDPSKVNVRQIR
jgi:fibrillarin-like rRNA methylase